MFLIENNITKISSRYTNKNMGFLIMQLLQRLHQLKIGLIRLTKQSSEYEKNKIHQKVQISRRIELLS